jgi:peptidoglycan/xylan/chitin deacetylase (PgdA/CDA1 family)
MSSSLTRWRRPAVVGLVVAGLAGAAMVVLPAAQAASARTLLSNGSAESVSRQAPKGWAKTGFGTNTRVQIVAGGGAQSGRRFVRTRITRHTSGAAWWYTPAVAVKGGSTYTYSEYYRSGGRTTVNAYFTVRGRIVGKQLAAVPASPTWKAFRAAFVAPAGATKVRFGHAVVSAGYVDVDNAALMAGGVVAPKPAPATKPPATTPPVTTPSATAPRPSPAVTAASGKGLISLTFDDGWTNQATNAGPILKAANLPGTFYLISDYLGAGPYMSVAQAKSLQAAGSEIGSHTVSHQNLDKLDPAALTRELANSKGALEAQFGPVTSLAYPYGAGNATVQAEAAKYYSSARATDPGNNVRGKYNRYALRIGYVLNTTPLSTVQGWINDAKANNSWLILCYHRIADDNAGDPYTTSVSAFRSQIDAVKASGVPVVTVRDGVQRTR